MWIKTFGNVAKYVLVPVTLFLAMLNVTNGAPVTVTLQIVTTLSSIKGVD